MNPAKLVQFFRRKKTGGNKELSVLGECFIMQHFLDDTSIMQLNKIINSK